MVIKKSPKRINSPYSSIRKPVSVQRKRIRKMPQRKAAVPWSFWRRVKKAIVFWRPIIRLRPMRKRIYFVRLGWVSVWDFVRGLVGSGVRFPWRVCIASNNHISLPYSWSEIDEERVHTANGQRTSTPRRIEINHLYPVSQ